MSYVQKFSVAQPLNAIHYQLFLSPSEQIKNISDIVKHPEVIEYFFKPHKESQIHVFRLSSWKTSRR